MESLLALLLCINAAVLPSMCSDYEGNFQDLTDNIVNGKKLLLIELCYLFLLRMIGSDGILVFSFGALVTLSSINHSDCVALCLNTRHSWSLISMQVYCEMNEPH